MEDESGNFVLALMFTIPVMACYVDTLVNGLKEGLEVGLMWLLGILLFLATFTLLAFIFSLF